MARRELRVVALILLGVVEKAELERVQVQLFGQFIHCRLEAVEAGHCTRAAHIYGRAHVAAHHATGDFEIGHTVDVGCGFATILVKVVELRSQVYVVLAKRQQLAFLCRSETDALLRTRTVADGGEHHTPIEAEFYWTSESTRGNRSHGGVWPREQLAAES